MSAMFSSSVTSLVLVFYIFVFANGLEENDPCAFGDGTQGVCKFLTECPSALEQLQRGKFPEKICGFQGTQSIICCKDGVTARPQPTTAPPATKPTPKPTPKPSQKPAPSITSRSPGDISKQKCKEYAQYAYDRSESPTLSLIPHYANTLECAFDKLELIVGGTQASRQEFPHMALIGYVSGSEVLWSCGGSLISENFVLTAGHCLKDRQLGPAKLVRIGMTNQSDTTNMQELRVSEVIRHPEYINEKYHDIGLLKLSTNAELNTYARPACLQTEKKIPFTRAIASGWGNIEFSGHGSNDLLKVVLEFFPTEKCNHTYRREINADNSNLKDGIIEDLMICAGSSKDLKDTCQGDSGGPLQVYHEDTADIKCMYNIIGVTSFGKSCGLAKNVPGVYTRVSAYLKWIEDVVWPLAK